MPGLHACSDTDHLTNAAFLTSRAVSEERGGSAEPDGGEGSGGGGGDGGRSRKRLSLKERVQRCLVTERERLTFGKVDPSAYQPPLRMPDPADMPCLRQTDMHFNMVFCWQAQLQSKQGILSRMGLSGAALNGRAICKGA